MAQFLCGALLLGTCVLLVVLIYEPEMKKSADAAAAIHGLKLAIGIVFPMALIVFVGAWGLARNKLWGWWVALLTDMGLFAAFLYSMIDDGINNIDWDMLSFTAVALVLAMWLLVPAVRRFYWADGEKSSAQELESTAAVGMKA